VAARRCPYGLFAAMAGAVSDLICEADNKLRPLHQILRPNVMIMKRLRNAGKPRLRSRVGRWDSGRRQSSTAAISPRSDGRGRRRQSAGGGVGAPGLSRQREQACSEGRPGGLARDFRDDLVGLPVERVNDLKSDELLGCHLEPVGVALDGVERPRGWVGELAQGGGGGGGSPRARIRSSSSGGAGVTVSGWMTVCASPSPDHLQVEVVGRSSAGEHRV
jgi:hypothetical protein